ncbi:TBCCD1 [Mytilus edulis]|uniref:TBCC domain-containing protein 1 n=1 Tax=Mytilus edulis TaxID=6550 RepID=A0A8S3UXH2_MYTED|nr:TBCCD1 [Mytilus edulis]
MTTSHHDELIPTVTNMMSSGNDSNVTLWVKSELFSYGALPIAPHPRLTFNNIKKIVIYAKNKGESCFPKLSYSVWRHIACNKLLLTEDLAWMYFHTCHLFSEDLSPVERMEWDQEMSNCSTKQERDQLKSRVKVNTLKFVLYLYVQQIHKVSLKASLVAGDEWPTTRSSSPDLDGTGRSTPRGNKTLDDHSHLVYIQSNMHEILELLVDPESYNRNNPSESLVSIQALSAISFLIAGSIDKCKSLLPIQDIAVLQTVQHRTGYSKLTKSFTLRPLQLWIKDCLVQNMFGISACIASGRRLSWAGAGEEKDVKSETKKRGKIATNAHVVPKEHIKGNKIIIMSQVSKQTIGRSSNTLENSSVKIHRCHYSYLYLLSPLRSVTIEKCRSTTIVLGPVETTIYLSHCEKVTLIAPCRNIMISGSTLCNLYTLTPNRPVILGGNDTLLLAPYHTFYPSIEDHMNKVGIGNSKNLWDQPLCVGPDHKDEGPVWELLPVSEFFTFNIPFEVEGTTTSIPGGLPNKYQKAVTQRQKQIDSWQKTVKDAGLNKQQRKEFQELVESRFHVWLAETNYKRELDSLVVPPPSTTT